MDAHCESMTGTPDCADENGESYSYNYARYLSSQNEWGCYKDLRSGPKDTICQSPQGVVSAAQEDDISILTTWLKPKLACNPGDTSSYVCQGLPINHDLKNIMTGCPGKFISLSR